MKNSEYCFPLTVSDLSSRFLLGIDAHPEISLEKTFRHFTTVFHSYGLPNRIRTDNGTPFASNALARLWVWFIKLGIYPELIEPGEPQQNGIHERMHRTLKQETTIPPASSMPAQQRKFDRFREEFNLVRPHEAIDMKPISINLQAERCQSGSSPMTTRRITWCAGSAAREQYACSVSKSL